eukprot:gene7883-5508_t
MDYYLFIYCIYLFIFAAGGLCHKKESFTREMGVHFISDESFHFEYVRTIYLSPLQHIIYILGLASPSPHLAVVESCRSKIVERYFANSIDNHTEKEHGGIKRNGMSVPPMDEVNIRQSVFRLPQVSLTSAKQTDACMNTSVLCLFLLLLFCCSYSSIESSSYSIRFYLLLFIIIISPFLKYCKGKKR